MIIWKSEGANGYINIQKTENNLIKEKKFQV